MPMAWTSLSDAEIQSYPLGGRIRNTSYGAQGAVNVEGVLDGVQMSLQRPTIRVGLIVRGTKTVGGGDPVAGHWIISVFEGTWYKQMAGYPDRVDGLDGKSLRLTEPWYERVQARRKAADVKHGANSIERIDADDPRWLSILGEEVGEATDEVLALTLNAQLGRVAHALTYDADASKLEEELIDVIAVSAAWLEARRRKADMDELLRNESPRA
jgi:hypothetical protein